MHGYKRILSQIAGTVHYFKRSYAFVKTCSLTEYPYDYCCRLLKILVLITTEKNCID